MWPLPKDGGMKRLRKGMQSGSFEEDKIYHQLFLGPIEATCAGGFRKHWH